MAIRGIVCWGIIIYAILPRTTYAHATFDKAVLSVYQKKPWLYKKHHDVHSTGKKAESISPEKIQKTATIVTTSTFGLRLYYSYCVRYALPKNRWFVPPFLQGLKQNISFLYDASTIALQTIPIHLLAKGALWYLYS